MTQMMSNGITFLKMWMHDCRKKESWFSLYTLLFANTNHNNNINPTHNSTQNPILMGQESFIYSFVARGTMVLAEYTEFTGNFPAIATQCLQKLPSTNSKFTYNCDHHTFNFLVQDGYGKWIWSGFGLVLDLDV